MKYIRTKDEIIENTLIEKKQIVGKIGECEVFWQPAFRMTVYEDDVVKQADTIEELCDEFVNNRAVLSKQDIKDILKYDKECLKTEIIYGAIWTDKGLIYVAKMNDKGELELL